PIFAIGRTRRLGWGVTYLRGDTIDYFIEDCRPGGSTGWQYRRDETWHDFQLRAEALGHKGHSAETLRIYENSLGTLEGDPEESGPGMYLSQAWVGDGEGAGRSIGTWLDVVACGDAAEAMDVVRECPLPTLVWTFADSLG